MDFLVTVKTAKNTTASFECSTLDKEFYTENNGISLKLACGFPYCFTITPSPGDYIIKIVYAVSIPLPNFHQAIVPDGGRYYITGKELVDFWATRWQSTLNNIRMPLMILTGLDHYADFAFGVIGDFFETDFVAAEPAKHRALVAWMRRFTVEIHRGTDEYPIPLSTARARKDNSITEYIYYKQGNQLAKTPWIACLREYARFLCDIRNLRPVTTPASLLPYWCSWTDWFSGDITDSLILDNAKECLALGIKNIIIDDGWYGAGTDYDFSHTLSMGDWSEDTDKIPDLKKLVRDIRSLGGNAILWCAPHGVNPRSPMLAEKKHLFIQNSPGSDMLTHNGYHSLCFMCPEARDLMADIIAGLFEKYELDGIKMDLFNNLPPQPCASKSHTHDTSSMIIGLQKTVARIYEKANDVRPNCIIELKQNYATPWLFGYGTLVRAGDTPYNPEGNYVRTAYINAYTPYSENDYQTITDRDSLEQTAVIILKMMAVGVPTYSMDMARLSDEQKEILRFYHCWYAENIDIIAAFRHPCDPDLGSWRLEGDKKDIYFLVNEENRCELFTKKTAQIANGTFKRTIFLTLHQTSPVSVSREKPGAGTYFTKSFTNEKDLVLSAEPGDIITISF
ncbi:MAG: hypothetical protein GF350_11585 [Chitinivibrionales bacterium]|nr:hypothetical protein [Chitinivibrionales bacterium]